MGSRVQDRSRESPDRAKPIPLSLAIYHDPECTVLERVSKQEKDEKRRRKKKRGSQSHKTILFPPLPPPPKQKKHVRACVRAIRKIRTYQLNALYLVSPISLRSSGNVLSIRLPFLSRSRLMDMQRDRPPFLPSGRNMSMTRMTFE